MEVGGEYEREVRVGWESEREEEVAGGRRGKETGMEAVVWSMINDF